MRHYKKGRKLGTDASHTKAMKKSLVANLFANDRIKTTLERAKEIRGDVDRVITWAKRGDVHARRLAIAKLGDKDLVAEIFSKVEQGMFAGRAGGYSRILRLGMRRGDSATIVIMELVLEPLAKKADKDAEEKPAAKAAGGKKVAGGKKAAADKDKGAAVDKGKGKGAEADAKAAEAVAVEVEAEEAAEVEAVEGASADEGAADGAADDEGAADGDAADAAAAAKAAEAEAPAEDAPAGEAEAAESKTSE